MKGYDSTKYPGVYTRTTQDGKNTFYILYRKPPARRLIFEKAVIPETVMTAAKANTLRSGKMTGRTLENRDRREQERKKKEAEKKWTIGKLWEAWKEDPENQGKRGTAKADNRYRKHLEKPFGNKEPKDIIQTDIDRLRLSLVKNNYAKETARSVISLFLRIIRYGAIKGYSPALPFPIVLKGKRLGNDPRIKRAPIEAEISAYIQTCQSWPDIQAGNFQLLMVYTGIRRGSARNLKWSDIDFRDGSAILRDSKTGTISIQLSDDALELLRNHPETEGVEYVFSGRGPGGYRSDREVDRIPAMIRDASGLPKDLDPCHMLRRNLATKLDQHGASTKTIMLAGGWKTPAMVHHYTATEKETVRDAVNQLARGIRKAEGGSA